MDQQNNPLVLDSVPQNFFKSFLETYDNRGSSAFSRKRNEFDLKYSVSHTITLVQQDLGTAMVESFPSQISSSFEIFHEIIIQLARKYESREVQGLPEVWKSLIHKISIQQRSMISEEGSELIPLEISGHENQGEQHSANIADSILSNAIQHTQVNERHNVTNSNNGSFVIDNMPYSPRAPHEPSKLGFAVFAAIIELFYVCFPSIFNCSAFTW
ncbi:hypothetical protein L6164_002868 [Bauhinia variegata]|uniref:Uncharacterized protein n=1 Tax=Bauhinia variegata TaxID=167791 RepID=A0ACB9PYZ2_BAUVA|nr:hypothetical protein L6164_002868 [Bauhinia variegata]